jgi:hypothetical protein
MHGPYHDFLLLPEGEAGERIYSEFWDTDPEDASDPPNYRAFRLINHGISVPDDLVAYMWDTLKWVPTEYPFEASRKWAMPWRGYGLDYHAHTAIRRRGAPAFRRICEAWAALFSQAPRTFELRGSWLPDEDRYERLVHHRKELVPLFQNLVCHAERASTGDYFILHVGL